MTKIIAIGTAVVVFLLALFYVLGISGCIGERTLVAKPAGNKESGAELVFFLPRTDLSVRVDWTLVGCEVDASGQQPIFTPAFAVSLAVTPVDAADRDQAFVLYTAAALPLFGTER